MHGDDPPRQFEAPLQLPDGHLHQQDAEEHEREPEDARRLPTPGGEQTEDEQEERPEDGRHAHMEVDGVVQVPEALDDVGVA